MKRSEVKVGETYAIGKYGTGDWDRRSAVLAVVLRAGEYERRVGDAWSPRKEMKPGWVCRIEEGDRAGEEVTIPSRQIFHTGEVERQRREQNAEAERRKTERVAVLVALAERLGGRAVLTRPHIELTTAQAQVLVDRLDALERTEAPA